MKTADTLAMLFGHNLWANLRLLERCAALTPEQLAAATLGGYGSIHDTLQHIVEGEQLYFSIVSTGLRGSRPKDAPATLAAMAQSARTTGAGLIEWAPRVQPGDTYPEEWDGALLAVPKSMMLTQAINHATEHRAQIMATLTQLGIQPPELDGWSYYDSLLPVNAAAVVSHIMQTFPVVETSEAYGYTFFFDGPDHRLPFATLSSSDNEHDRVSNLDRPGVYRLNIGVSKQTFQSLFGAAPVDVSRYDFTTLDTLMPHPEYAAQSFICVLAPTKATFERVRPLLAEAYDIAVRRHARPNQAE